MPRSDVTPLACSALTGAAALCGRADSKADRRLEKLLFQVLRVPGAPGARRPWAGPRAAALGISGGGGSVPVPGVVPPSAVLGAAAVRRPRFSGADSRAGFAARARTSV
jgi:hypothetical protein